MKKLLLISLLLISCSRPIAPLEEVNNNKENLLGLWCREDHVCLFFYDEHIQHQSSGKAIVATYTLEGKFGISSAVFGQFSKVTYFIVGDELTIRIVNENEETVEVYWREE